jgi:membrane fusion protein, multidrug efflux system
VESLIVPEEAIVPERSKQYVLVVGPDAVVERREVRSGRRRPGEIEILEGLEPGERVITEGTQNVRPGQRVTILSARET